MDLNKIKFTRCNLGKSSMCSGDKYRIYMCYNGKKTSFIFHDNYKNKSGLKDYLYCLLSDKNAYEFTRSNEDFMLEFGYKTIREAKRIREACKRNGDKLSKLFTNEELDEIQELLNGY